ncbi:E3 ubiquitin-protein ligase RNF216-like isoform X1 [Pseudoliparis swirei]|uniref:E3 ubiquitin-protein ligase RNF216-like isoform X1 n=1 Tax=Pseudoliparis swirei TaxID=2059687 RepID=UPI0024BE1175|nr:E3 ubiquitin-protein ligase RNF216-like isoform X1 [Pseudoliparis swirei]
MFQCESFAFLLSFSPSFLPPHPYTRRLSSPRLLFFLQESCRKCHVEWKQHVGKTCEQVLEKDEIRKRQFFEERMTAARVRKCVKCTMGLVKSEGCNLMSCRCSSLMCYLCREQIKGYKHFCQHAHNPGEPCEHCHKCSLWTDPTQDDERIIRDIQKEGEAELNKKSLDNPGKRVGAPPEPIIEAKRLCVHPLHPQPAAPPPPAGWWYRPACTIS